MNGAFPSFQAFLHMGGYAATVWPAYGAVLLVLLVQFILAKVRFNRFRRSLAKKHVKPS